MQIKNIYYKEQPICVNPPVKLKNTHINNIFKHRDGIQLKMLIQIINKYYTDFIENDHIENVRN